MRKTNKKNRSKKSKAVGMVLEGLYSAEIDTVKTKYTVYCTVVGRRRV